jgi:RNA polymerase sigma-70 factor (ECF subfamily)
MAETLSSIDRWVVASSRGDAQAIQSLLLHFHDPLLSFIKSSLATRDSVEFSAEDLLQETLIEACRGIKKLDARGGASFFAWLKSIAQSRHLNRVKAARALKRGGNGKRIVRASGEDRTATSILNLIAGADARPSVIVRRNEAIRVIAAVVAKLEPDRRRVIELRYGQGLSNSEVAARVGKSEGAVKMLLSRILEELRATVKADFKDFSLDA